METWNGLHHNSNGDIRLLLRFYFSFFPPKLDGVYVTIITKMTGVDTELKEENKMNTSWQPVERLDSQGTLIVPQANHYLVKMP